MPEVKTNGIATNYEEAGSGPAVVFIHGHSLDLRMWNYQVEKIAAAGFRVIQYDVRGHGESSAPEIGYTWDNYVRDLAELLDQIEVSAAHVVGCSMGGGIALGFTLAHPKRVTSLTLVDTILPGFSYSQDFGKLVGDLRTAYRSEGQAAFERLWLTDTLFEGVARQPERFAEVREQVMAYPAREYRLDYAGEPGYKQPNMTKRLTEIMAPTLVVVGEHDLDDFRLIAEMIASHVNRAKLSVFTDAWHLPSVEQPERFNEALLEFLREDVRQNQR